MAKKAGFVVYNKLEDFNDSKLKMRVILCNSRSEDEKKQLCDVKLIMGKILIRNILLCIEIIKEVLVII